MTRADFEAVRNPVLALGAILLGVAAAVYYTDLLAKQASRDLVQQEKQLKDARMRLHRSGDEKELIVRYLGSYQQLEKRGFAGDEQRINWLDALRQTNQQVDLFGVDYDIGTQKPYPFAASLNPGSVQLRESVMKLRFRLLHEEDLLRFLDVLSRQGAGIYTVDQCSLRRLDTRGVIRYQPNLAAECELAWITASARVDSGEKTVKLAPFALVLLLIAPPAVAAEKVGRIFYTPDQRGSLDVARSKRARNALATDKAEDAPPPAPTPEVVTYGGMVRRSDGKTTVWLNNHAVTGKESADAKMVGKIRPDGTVTLQSPQTGRNVDLRVGQRAELLSGRVEEGYRFTPPPKPEMKTDRDGTKPAPEAAAATEAERRKEERERQESLDDAVRALRDAAKSASAGAPAPAPLQQSGTPPPQVVAPPPAPATK